MLLPFPPSLPSQWFTVIQQVPYLSFREVEVDSYFVASQSGQIVVVCELWLQFPDLFFGEGCALLPGLAVHVWLIAPVLGLWNEKQNIFQPQLSLQKREGVGGVGCGVGVEGGRTKKKKEGLKKKKLERFDKLQGPIWNKNKMKARRLGVPITFYCGDLVLHPVLFNPSREFAPRWLHSVCILWSVKTKTI